MVSIVKTHDQQNFENYLNVVIEGKFIQNLKGRVEFIQNDGKI